MKNIFRKKKQNLKKMKFQFGDHNPPCTCHGPAEDMRYIQLAVGDVDWGTSNSDCVHLNFPCEKCGADIGDAFKEGFHA